MVRHKTLTKIRERLYEIRDTFPFLSLVVVTHVPDRYDSRMSNIDYRKSKRFIMLDRLNNLILELDGLKASIDYWIATLVNPTSLDEFESLYKHYIQDEYNFYKHLIHILKFVNKTDLEYLWSHYKKVYGENRWEAYECSRPYLIMRAIITQSNTAGLHDSLDKILEDLKNLGDVLDPRYRLCED